MYECPWSQSQRTTSSELLSTIPLCTGMQGKINFTTYKYLSKTEIWMPGMMDAINSVWSCLKNKNIEAALKKEDGNHHQMRLPMCSDMSV